MGDDIGSGLSSMSVCFDFRSTNIVQLSNRNSHGLRTPNEGINQRYLKNWADMADKICCRHT